MEFLSIELIKAHTRIDGDLEDSLLEQYGNAAEQTVLNYMSRSVEDLYDCYGEVPHAVVQAALLLVENGYEHRSPASMSNLYRVDYGFDALIRPYMVL